MTDPAREDLIIKARTQNALLAALGLLALSLVLILITADPMIGARKFVLAFGGMTFLVPLLALKGFLSERPPAGMALATAANAAGGYLGTMNPLVALVCAASGAAAAYAFYKIKNNTNYRPRLLGEKR